MNSMIGHWVVATDFSQSYYATQCSYDERYIGFTGSDWTPVACFGTHEEAKEFAAELNQNFTPLQAAK